MAMMSIAASAKLNSVINNWGSLPLTPRHNRVYMNPVHCSPLQQQQQQQQQQQVDAGILCEPCNGKGWLLCDFCKGQKTNVKAENKRIYRRCPSCKAGIWNNFSGVMGSGQRHKICISGELVVLHCHVLRGSVLWCTA